MKQLMPIWLPLAVIATVAIIVISIGELFLALDRKVGSDMALTVGLGILGTITAGSFVMANLGSKSEGR